MALLVAQDISEGGTFTTQAAAGGGDQVPQGSIAAGAWTMGVFLFVSNADVGAHTVTVAGRPAINVPAGATALIPVNAGVYPGHPVNITYDAVTSVTVAAVRLGGDNP